MVSLSTLCLLNYNTTNARLYILRGQRQQLLIRHRRRNIWELSNILSSYRPR